MNDRELLELAAKAGGIFGAFSKLYQPYGDGWVDGIDTGACKFWNPLTDDGDALRLAVALELEVYPATKDDQRACAVDSDRSECWAWEDVNGDKYAAMRRAIVRAAAEIGKKSNAYSAATPQPNPEAKDK